MMKRILLITVLPFLINGCAVKFVYNQLDWVIPWYFGDYISLNNEQRDYLNVRLKYHLQWHRQTQLPDYAHFLRTTSNRIADGLTREELDELNSELEIFGRALSAQIAPDLAQLFLSANDQQLKDMYQQLDKDNNQFKQSYLDITENKLRHKRLKETQGYLERWLGGLTRHQQNELEIWSHEFKPISHELMAHKLLWQQNFKSLMARRHETPTIKEELIDMFAEPDKDWKPEYKEKTDFNKEQIAALFLRIDAHMTQRQRKKLTKKLISLAGDLEDLAKKS